MVRREGRDNVEVLRCIKQKLHDEGIDRPLARILDALVWFSHPAAGGERKHRSVHRSS